MPVQRTRTPTNPRLLFLDILFCSLNTPTNLLNTIRVRMVRFLDVMALECSYSYYLQLYQVVHPSALPQHVTRHVTIHLSKLFILLLLSILWLIFNSATNIRSKILHPSRLWGVCVDKCADECVGQLKVCDCTAQASDGTFDTFAKDLVLGDTGANA